MIISHIRTENKRTKKERKKKRKGKQEQEERCDAYLGASSGGVWKDEERILPRLLLSDRHRDL
jgi:hypothetical protein